MDVVAQPSFVDLHSHSSVSFDSLADPRKLVARALRLGLTHLAITDHERIDGALRARDAAMPGIQVIVGQEVRTASGDLIGLFLERPVAPGLSPQETAAAIREQGGLVGLPHPFDRFRASSGARGESGPRDRGLEALLAEVDYVEVHNARAYGSANPRAAELARNSGLPGVACSDAHSVMEVGIASTVLPGPFSSARELLDLLPEAKLVTARAAYVVRLWTPLAKVVQRLRGNRRVAPAAAGPSSRP